jgi:3-dehydroquinate synthase
VIGYEALFEIIRSDYHTSGPRLFEAIRRAIAVKAAIVSEDEREGDRRRLLNYGHTIGHAIETAAGYGSITHGEAVGWGMIGANAIAAARGILSGAERERIDGAIAGLMPRKPAGATRDATAAAAGLDKKFTARGRAMVLPVKVGECAIVEDVTSEELALGIAAALSSA